jgi:hypothetical protein
MASLSGQNPSATFGSLIKSINNLAVSGTLVQLSDGNGNALPISVSTVNVSISSPLTASIVAASNNGNGTNFKVGDDAWIGDVNLGNTLQVKGQQDGTKGYIKFTNFAAGPVIGAASSSILELTGSLNATGNLTAAAGITGSLLGTASYALSVATASVAISASQATVAGSLQGGLSTTTGTWTLTPGANNVSFTVDPGYMYQMWVRSNIPNGIITWIANVVTSNTNVPVIGSQYGWYYATGNALVLNSMPNQIIGTSGSIVNSPTSYAPNTSNVFNFSITNNSGTNQSAYWGYIKM